MISQSHEFATMMSREFEMSMIGELTFFLGFQVKQLKEGTFIHQEKYTKDMLKKFKMDECKPIKTHMSTNGHLDLDVDGKCNTLVSIPAFNNKFNWFI